MKPRKMTTIQYKTPEGKRCKSDTPGAVKSEVESRKYYAQITLPNGKRKSVPLATDYARSKQMLTKIEGNVIDDRHGIGDTHRVHNARPLADHLGDWKRAMTAGQASQAHVEQTVGRAEKVFDACEFTSIRDINALDVQEHLAALLAGGSSIQTVNFYGKACQQFARWLVANERASSSKLVNLQMGNVEADRRHDRREIIVDEVKLILAHTESAPDRRGFSGADRAMLYRAALGTGLRAMELYSLTPKSFRLEGRTPTVTIEARHSKNGEEVRLPLSIDNADRLRSYLTGRPRGGAVWPGRWAIDFAAGKMFRRDLDDTRAAWIARSRDAEEAARRESSCFLAYKNEEGLFADFHALRHTFITGVVRGGASPAVCQFLARHSSITITMKYYSHLNIFDVAGAVQDLPSYDAEEYRPHAASAS